GLLFTFRGRPAPPGGGRGPVTGKRKQEGAARAEARGAGGILRGMTASDRPRADGRPPWRWPRPAYVHVPFCAHHCNYCDLDVAAGQDHLIDRYLDALAAELATLGTPQPVRTLFLGGGTPTHLSPRQLERLLRDVLRWLPPGPGHEFSVEANPGTL